MDGWGHDVYTHEKAFTASDWGIRNKWLWNPTSTTQVLLSFTHMHETGEEGLGFNQVPGYAAKGGHGFCPGEGPPPNFTCPAGTPGPGYVGFYNTTDYTNDVAVNDHDLVELKVTQDTPVVRIVNIAGYQRMTGFAKFNQDSSIYADTQTKLYQDGRDWSDEFQLLSPDNTPYSNWLKQWIAGFYYLHDISGYGGPNGGAQLQGLSFGLPVQFVPPSYYIELADGVYTTSYSGYGQATFQVYPDTDVILGARYTTDNRIFTGGLFTSPALGGATIINTQPNDPGANRTWDMQSYRAELTHQWTDDVMTFFSFDRGEKSGQFDTFGTAAAGPVITPPVDPEVLLSYQLGIKSQWLNDTLQVNATAFHYDVKNLQFAIIIPGGTQLINAAAATENGGEIEGTWIPATNLTLTSALSVLYGHYTSFDNAPDYFIPGCTPTGPILCKTNASGSDMIRAPHYTWNMGADYVIPSSIGDFDVNVNYTYTDTFQWFPDGSLSQPATNIFNASLTWTNPTGMFDVRLWGANLGGDEYYSFGSESYGLGQQFSPAPPRTYGITLGAHI
jgi:iron complex outermembrane receptor protein